MQEKAAEPPQSNISAPSRLLFEQALRSLSVEDAERALVELASCPLPTLERDRRICLVTRMADFTPERVTELVAKLPPSRHGVLNAIRTALPDHLRPFANVSSSDSLSTPKPASTPNADGSPKVVVSGNEGERYRAVILIGNQTEHTHNRALLERHSQLQPLRIASSTDLANIANTGICGIVVGPSVWLGLDVGEQECLARQILEFSTFSYLKLVTQGMHEVVAAKLQSIAQLARCGKTDCFRLNLAITPDIGQTDLHSFLTAATELRVAETSKFRSLDLTEDESTLLRLIGTVDEDGSFESYGAKRLYGGQTAAKVFLVETTRGRRVVVKFNNSSVLCKEMDRYHAWIQNWDDATNPVFHRHITACAIVYRLQSRAGSSIDPAPTLQSALQKLVMSEWHDGAKPWEEQGENLSITINHAVRKLVELNKQKSQSVGDQFWLHWPAASLAKKGISILGTNEASPNCCLFQQIEFAEAQVARLHQAGSVHGDINGGNVLVVDRVPVFIDFEHSGPGNPFVDLVRLDAVVRLHAMRAILPESELVELFRRLYVDCASVEELLTAFAPLRSSAACRLCLQTAVVTRDAALEIADAHGATRLDYFATVAIVAAYSLSLLSPGSGVERACLTAALEPVVRNAQAATARVEGTILPEGST
jgi:hypothetical protein